ncbi:MAG: sensor histidine kinase [Sterolibacterium sp.]
MLRGRPLAAIFDAFFRGGAERSASGFGLGLAITRRIIEAHGGRVFAANRLGGGLLVTLELPCFFTQLYLRPPPDSLSLADIDTTKQRLASPVGPVSIRSLSCQLVESGMQADSIRKKWRPPLQRKW